MNTNSTNKTTADARGTADAFPSAVPAIRHLRFVNRPRRKLCPSPFVIWFRERTGSTFLCSLLSSHPDICCRQEDFDIRLEEASSSEPGLIEFKGKHYRRQLSRFNETIVNPTHRQNIEHLRQLLSRNKRACGFKFKFDIQMACYQEIVDELFWVSRQLKVLFLTRANYLKQAVSRQNMERIMELRNNTNLTDKEELPPIRLDVERAVKYARYMANDTARFEQSAAQFDHVLRVSYEELSANPQAELNRILEYLELDPVDDIEQRVHKATHDSLAVAVENYDELVEAVRGTPFEQYLD